MQKNIYKNIFLSELYAYHKNVTYVVVDKEKLYDYSMKRSLYEIVIKYCIPFVVDEIVHGEWYYEKYHFPNTSNIILFILDTLNIKLNDIMLIIENLFLNNIIKTVSHANINEIVNNFNTINEFYETNVKTSKFKDCKNINICIDTETIILNRVDIAFYKKSSHAVKYIIDTIFYQSLNYIRNTHYREKKVLGHFAGCSFKFEGYEDIKNTKKERIYIEKEYESFDENANKIKTLKKYEDIKIFSKGLV